MELDDLKSIWKNKQGYVPKQEEEIASMLRGRSNSIINKLKRSVWFELIFTIVCGVGLGIYTLTIQSGALMWTIISLLVLFVSYLIYYVKKIILLNQFDPSSDNLKENLQHLLERLTVYLNFYKRSYAILYPVYFMLGLLFGALERGMDDFLNHMSQPRTIFYLVALSALFFLCTIWVTNWYLKKLYGNHLEKLKELLKELQA
jgi:O-antigen/teichoic acid export membrane protein